MFPLKRNKKTGHVSKNFQEQKMKMKRALDSTNTHFLNRAPVLSALTIMLQAWSKVKITLQILTNFTYFGLQL